MKDGQLTQKEIDMESELGTILELAEMIAEKSGRTEDLCKTFDMSTPTLRRRLSLLRHFGAKIKSVRTSGAKTGKWSYQIENWSQIKKMVKKWRELEAMKESLTTDKVNL